MPELTMAAVAAGVGVLVGASGVGGVLLISYLALFAGLGIHEAAATSLFSFIFTGLAGTWLFRRKGSIDWRLAFPVCAGALVATYLGTFIAARASTATLSMVVGSIIVAAGLATLLPRRGGRAMQPSAMARSNWALALVGVFSGLGSGVSGAGGPVFSVPIMMTLRYAALAAIGTSQVLQLVSAVSGSIGNLQRGLIDWKVALIVTAFQLLGVAAGVHLAHSMPTRWLKLATGALCVIAGAMMLAKR